MIILLPSILGFTVVSMNIWGPYSPLFNTFQASFTTNMLASVGIVNTFPMFTVNPVWTAMFIIYSWMMFSMFLLAAFKGIYLEARNAVRYKIGYPESDFRINKSAAVWWLLGFLPLRVLGSIQKWWNERQLEAQLKEAQNDAFEEEEENRAKSPGKGEKEDENKDMVNQTSIR